jgi:glycosyltransferase involved in cell wall biosynthesis
MRLIIFTNYYPYGYGDFFVEKELRFHYLNGFNEIVIFPLCSEGDLNFPVIDLPIRVEKPLLNFSIWDKWRILLHGFNPFSNNNYIFREFFVNHVYSNLTWFRNWFSSSLLINALFKKRRFNRILDLVDKNTVLYFYWGDKAAQIIPFLRKRINNPIIVRFHGSDLYEEAKGGYQPYRKPILKNIHYAIPISEMGEKYLLSKYSDIQLNCKVFRLGLFKPDTINKPSIDGVLRIVSCSNIIKLKRLSLLMGALMKIKEKVSWTIIGDGALKQDLINQSKELPSNIETNFIGLLRLPQIYNLYSSKSFDLFINVSESEGIPVSIMEAISFGIPVIATDVGGTHEIVDEKIGYLVQKDITSEQLADVITTFNKLDFTSKATFRKNALYRWDEKFNAERNYNQFAGFLKSLRP